jgi:hypothetical protein
LAEGTVTRLADAGNSQVLAQYRTEWLAKEQQDRLAVMIRPWRAAIVMGLLTLVSLAWPWLLIALKSSLKRFVVYMSIAAIPGQVLIFLWLELYRHPPSPRLPGEAVEWPQLALGCEVLILLFVPLQFGYLILQKLKPEALPPIKTTANVILLFGTCTVLAWAILGAIHLLARLSPGTAG